MCTSPAMPRSVSGRKTCSCPRDCSVRAAHRRNSKTCPDALSSLVVQGRVMGPDSRFADKNKEPCAGFPHTRLRGREGGSYLTAIRGVPRQPLTTHQLLPRAAMLGLWTSIKAPPNRFVTVQMRYLCDGLSSAETSLHLPFRRADL